MIIDDLVFDRTAEDSMFYAELYAKGFEQITADEQRQWLNGNDQFLYDSNGEKLYDSDGNALCVVGTVVRGCYNYTDMNRVGEAVQYLANILIALGYSVIVTAKQDWAVGDLVGKTEQDAYLADLTELKTIVSVNPDVPTDWTELNWTWANDIEQILFNIYKVIKTYRNDAWVCGEAVCGGY